MINMERKKRKAEDSHKMMGRGIYKQDSYQTGSFLGAGTELNVQDVSTLRSRVHEKLLWSFEELALTKMSALSARGISTNSNSLPSGYGCMGGREAGLEKRDTGWSTSIATLR